MPKQFLLLLLICPLLIFGQGQPNRQDVHTGTMPAIKPIKLPNGDVQLGKITLHRRLNEISFPAELTIGAEPSKEYLIVTDPGLQHETLFFSDIQAYYLQFMLYLIGGDNKTPRDQKGRHGSIIDIDVEWRHSDGKLIRQPVENWLIDEESKKVAQRRGFYFLGSKIVDGFYQAQGNGKICSLWHQSDAVLDIIHPANNEQNLFMFNYKKLHPVKFTQVRLIMSLRKEP